MEIKDRLGKAKEIKEGHKKGKHWNQHKYKEVQVEWQEENPEKELEVEIKDRCNGTLQITVTCLRHFSSHDCASALDSAISDYPNPIGQPYAYAQTVLSLSIDLT